jgi:phosphoglycolate phosphatase
VIGDTPHDVQCALAHGCRCLGVATGRSSVRELLAAGASRAVEDLSDTQGVLTWLGLGTD